MIASIVDQLLKNLSILSLINFTILLFLLYYIKHYKLNFTETTRILYISIKAKCLHIKAKHCVAFLTLVILILISIFVAVSIYKIMFTYNKEVVKDISLSMLQIFIAIFGITLAIIGFWSYSSIKEHAIVKTTELTDKKLKEYDIEIREFLSKTAKLQESSMTTIHNLDHVTQRMKNILQDVKITEEEMKSE